MVEECSSESRAGNECVDVKVATEVMPRGGDVVYAVGHQHAGGIGTSLHGQVYISSSSALQIKGIG